VVTPDALSAPVPSVVAPSLKVTLPVGVPAAVEVTVAVKVTDWPLADGFTEEVSAVDVVPFTVCVSTDEVLPAKLVSPA